MPWKGERFNVPLGLDAPLPSASQPPVPFQYYSLWTVACTLPPPHRRLRVLDTPRTVGVSIAAFVAILDFSTLLCFLLCFSRVFFVD